MNISRKQKQRANESRSTDTDKEVSSVTVGDVEGGIHGSIIAGRDVIQKTITKIFGGGQSEVSERRNRLILLEKVKNFWVEGVLEKSVHSAALIELNRSTRD